MSVVVPETPRTAVSGTRRSGEGRNPVLFPRYPEYKDSGVAWLEHVPSHWEIARFKQVFSERDERSKEGTETLLSVSAYTGVTPRADLLEDGEPLSRSESFEGYKVCYPDDLVVNIMLAWNRGLAFTSLHGIVSPAYCVYTVIDDSVPRFLNYLVRSNKYIGYFKAFSSGVIDSRLRIYPDVFGRLYIALPSEREQKTIAAFLDRETAKIDALIAEQEKLIVLLKEKRQALISHAVTKGLDPNAPMKDSGIEWLGQVPLHWDTRRVGSISTKITNGFVGPTRDILRDDGVRYLQSLHIKCNRIQFNHPYFVDQAWSGEHAKSILEVGDVLIVQTGDIGQVAVVTPEYEGCNCHALIIVAPDRTHVVGEWLSWMLNSEYGRQSLLAIQTGALHPHLNCGNVKDVLVPVPPLTEQIEIVAAIESKLRAFDDLESESERVIALFKERRAALISAAVTGKIDVRGKTAKVAA